MGRAIRVLIIAPQDLSRTGLVTLLGRPGSTIRVVGAFRDFEDGEAALSQLDPQVLLLDDTLPPTRDIVEELHHLHRKFSHLSVIVISGRLQVRYLQLLFGAGASGYIYRDDRLEESLTSGIETVSQGYFYTSPRASGLGIGNRMLDPTMQLNPSDLDVLRLFDQGLTPKEIAAALKVTTRTVYRIRNKLGAVVGAPTHERLLMAAREKGLLTDAERAPTDSA